VGYEFLDHPADVLVRVTAATLEELFEEAARALMDCICDRSTVERKEEITLAAVGSSRERLLVNWLQEVLYTVDAEGMLLADFSVRRLEEGMVEGAAYGERIDPERHRLYSDVKAVTHHGLSVDDDGDGYTVELVFDI